jgi:hypothetical protein
MFVAEMNATVRSSEANGGKVRILLKKLVDWLLVS